jgi:23S rRNA pseudouridine1911/1915/1917 synthase
LSLHTHITPTLAKPIRIQEYLVGIFEQIPTKSALKKAIKRKEITINGEVANTARMLSGGELIEYSPTDTKPQKTLNLKLDVLFEDDYLAVIHKPNGIEVSGNSFKTIERALSTNLKTSLNEDKCRPQAIHRLDFATSGALLIGKTHEAVRELNKLFAEKAIKKEYYAICVGKLLPTGQIDTLVDDKESLSKFSTIATKKSIKFGALSLVQLIPETGRRHQLRKHLSGIGHPILGDRQYANEVVFEGGKGGLFLHSYSLSFIHPNTDENLCVKSDLPDKFKQIFKEVII